jgi:hypothetical protein
VRYRAPRYLSVDGDRVELLIQWMLLPRAKFRPAAMPPADYLLHREEGIDLRLSLAARTRK